MEHWSFQSERGLLPLDPAPIGPWQEGQNMYDWLASYGYARHEFDLEVGPLVRVVGRRMWHAITQPPGRIRSV